MSLSLITFACLCGYPLIAGVTFAFMRWKGYLEDKVLQDDFGRYIASIFWPATLPAMLANELAKRVFDHVDSEREKAKKYAAEMKRRLDELDAELRAAKGAEQ